jgi:hypothetical protein
VPSKFNFLRALRVLRGNSIARWQRRHREQDGAPLRAIGMFSNGKVSRALPVTLVVEQSRVALFLKYVARRSLRAALRRGSQGWNGPI